MVLIMSLADCAEAEEASGATENSTAGTEPAEIITEAFVPLEPITLTPQQAEKLIYDNIDAIEIVDLRTGELFDEGRLEGSIFFPYDEMQEHAESAFRDKGQTILLYCQTGEESPKAANFLVNLGYKNVYILEGGIDNWHGPIINQYHYIRFDALGSRPENSYIPFSQIMEQALHADMEAFTFIVEGNYVTEYLEWWRNPGWFRCEQYPSVHTITIQDTSGVTVQVFTDLDTARLYDPPLEFHDWNFDGYMDLSLFQYPGGTANNQPAYYWLWNPGTNRFMQNDDLMGMNWPWIDTEKRLIQDAYNGGGGYFRYSTYEYTNGRFVEIQRTVREIIPDPEGSGNTVEQTTETDFVTGEVTITKTPYHR